MTIAELLQSVCELLHRRTNVPATLGLPTDKSEGLFVWPWKITEAEPLRNTSPAGTQGGRDSSPELPPLDVHFLILVRSPIAPQGLSLLELARRAIHETPVVVVGGERAQLLTDVLSTAELTALFTASAQPLTVCLCIRGRLPPAADPRSDSPGPATRALLNRPSG